MLSVRVEITCNFLDWWCNRRRSWTRLRSNVRWGASESCIFFCRILIVPFNLVSFSGCFIWHLYFSHNSNRKVVFKSWNISSCILHSRQRKTLTFVCRQTWVSWVLTLCHLQIFVLEERIVCRLAYSDVKTDLSLAAVKALAKVKIECSWRYVHDFSRSLYCVFVVHYYWKFGYSFHVKLQRNRLKFWAKQILGYIVIMLMWELLRRMALLWNVCD